MNGKQISIPLTREDLAASFVFFLADLSRCTWIMEVERTPSGHAQYLFLPSSLLVGVAESWQESGNKNDYVVLIPKDRCRIWACDVHSCLTTGELQQLHSSTRKRCVQEKQENYEFRISIHVRLKLRSC